MNTDEIYRILKRAVRGWDIGVIPRNKIRPPRKKCLYVCNTDPASKKGQHWIAICIDAKGVGYYFDSYGRFPAHGEFIWFLNRYSTHWIYNDI